MLGEHVEVLGLQRGAVDAGQRVGQRPRAVGHLERQEVVARRLVGALAEVQDVAALARDRLEKPDGVGRVDVADPGAGPAQVGAVGLLDVADVAAVQAPRALVGEDLQALAGGGAGHERLAFDVADHGRHELGVGADELHRAADQRPVLRVRSAAPLVAVGVLLGHLPQLQGVVGEMVVQLDQSRERGAAETHRGDVLEAVRRRRSGVLHGGDPARVDVDGAAGVDGEVVVHRHHAPREGHLGSRAGIGRDRRRHVAHVMRSRAAVSRDGHFDGGSTGPANAPCLISPRLTLRRCSRMTPDARRVGQRWLPL